MLRSIAAVVAGYVVFGGSAELLFQISGQDPHAASSAGFKVASVIWGVVFALIAGWLTARIAVRRPATHAGILAGLIALSSVMSMAFSHAESLWTQVAALVFMAPAAWIGGSLARRQL
jgi:multisubunit Na+/H+ antiporter MnhE subunit